MKHFLLAAMALPLFTLHACKKNESNNATPHIYKGAPAAIGNGRAWSWVETDDQGLPKTLGITFEKTAFSNLPDGHTGGMSGYKLTLPGQAYYTPFDHITLDWNPHGHAPDHVYDKPHFDMHFYMMTEQERMKIPEYGADSSGFQRFPSPDYLPANYIPIPGGEGMMGKHWADVTSPELSQTDPKPFTQTFIYGTYNGAVTFYEPMATLAFLTTTKSFSRPIPQPAKYGKDGYYPARMSITDKGSTLEVTLHDFTLRHKS